ncbi:MAG TPA: M1 family metallopeptidase [Terriglobales bacterium]|nr:M1 family metallopeptidase [Terriglobales bacterium]
MKPSAINVVLFGLLLSSLCLAQRLPKDAVPSHYTIHFNVDIAAGRFGGEETIALRLAKASGSISLNAVGLTISDAYVTARGKRFAAKVRPQPEQEMVAFDLTPGVPAGAAELHLKFAAPLRDDLRGLYRTRSDRRQYAATQFEGTYARMAFPSFDEPEFKATFDITVETDAADTAISNGALIKTFPGPGAGKHTLEFATSPKISTYLVALAVGDFGCVEGASDGIPIRICAVPEKKEMGRFALKAAESFLSFYNKYYGIKYPFKKLDMVAIPNYEWGGMENTAAIFYKERALLIEEKTASVGAKRGVASVVGHEMAHQWFGDLVTMQWWDNVWLNEGFATWMTFKPLAAWDKSWDQTVSRALSAQGVITQDSLASSRPIRANASTPEEIKELFDGVAYEKGAAVLRMVETFVGEEVFRTGVNRYLQRHANGNATAEDLWTELTAASRKPVDKVMQTFVDKPGVPLLTVEAACTGGRLELRVAQERFGGAGNAGQVWNIPLCSRKLTSDPKAAEMTAVCVLMTKPVQEMTFDSCNDRVINAGASGYYRTSYAPQMMAKVSGAAEAGKLTAAETIFLLGDQWALVRAGRSNIGDYLDLSAKLRESKENAVLQQVIGRVNGIRSTFPTAATQPKFDAWQMRVLRPAMERVGLEAKPGDSDDLRNLRAQLFALMGGMGESGSVARARAIVEQALRSPGSVDAGMANVAFSIAAQNGDAALYDRILTAMNNAKGQSPEQYSRSLFALAQFSDPALVKRSLEYVRSPQMPPQDVIGFMSTLIGNPESRDAAWSFLKQHWMEMREKVVSFGGGGAVGALSGYCDLEHRKDIEDFFREHRAPGAERTVKLTLERISSCVAFKEKQQPQFEKWLAQQQ